METDASGGKSIPAEWNARVEHITNLPKNWDGHGGGPVSADIIDIVRTLLAELFNHDSSLPLPRILTGGDNTVEITFDDSDFEIYIAGPDSIEVEHGGREFAIAHDYSLLGDYVRSNRIV